MYRLPNFDDYPQHFSISMPMYEMIPVLNPRETVSAFHVVHTSSIVFWGIPTEPLSTPNFFNLMGPLTSSSDTMGPVWIFGGSLASSMASTPSTTEWSKFRDTFLSIRGCDLSSMQISFTALVNAFSDETSSFTMMPPLFE